MHVTVDRRKLFAMLDVLVPRWQKKLHPFNKKDAIIPQRVIPQELRDNKFELACFYLYICIYMRGGIESLQAFKAMLRLRNENPHLFDPAYAQFLDQSYVQGYLKKYVGWDSVQASKNWIENSRRIMQSWGGDPRNLLKGLRTYDEALRRIKNKLGKGERKDAGPDGLGFQGFQHKMVSMFIYFMDWEGMLEKRFLYPAPADFHNFRLGFNQGIIKIDPMPEQGFIRTGERISKVWRAGCMAYLRARKADPIQVADAIWMQSLTNCGNSPLMPIREVPTNGSGIFSNEELPHKLEVGFYRGSRFRKQVEDTCLRCALIKNCSLAIPANPYYRRGELWLVPRFKIEEHTGTIDPDTPSLSVIQKKVEHPKLTLGD